MRPYETNIPPHLVRGWRLSLAHVHANRGKEGFWGARPEVCLATPHTYTLELRRSKPCAWLRHAGSPELGIVSPCLRLAHVCILNLRIAVPAAPLRHTDSPEMRILRPCTWFRHAYFGQVPICAEYRALPGTAERAWPE